MPGWDAQHDRDGMLRVAIDGRVTAEAVGGLRAALEDALAAGRPFAVLFDRRAMTGPTPEGRAALLRWSAELLPRLHPACAAWADVLDERRAASVERADGGGARPDHGYPRRTFSSTAEAERWLLARLATAAARRPAPSRRG